MPNFLTNPKSIAMMMGTTVAMMVALNQAKRVGFLRPLIQANAIQPADVIPFRSSGSIT